MTVGFDASSCGMGVHGFGDAGVFVHVPEVDQGDIASGDALFSW